MVVERNRMGTESANVGQRSVLSTGGEEEGREKRREVCKRNRIRAGGGTRVAEGQEMRAPPLNRRE
jgi:hypothetical protein